MQYGYQGHGIGTQLFTLLARIGWDGGARRFVADTYAENRAMLDVCMHTPCAVMLTNDAPGGTGNRVRVGGIEVWTMGASGLVANSIGFYDAATYERQLAHGIER